MAEKQQYARWPQVYGSENFDRGQVIRLRGLPNDEALERLGYVADIPKDTSLRECGVCQQKFIDEGSRNDHAEKRHRTHYGLESLNPEQEDEEAEREEKLLVERAPLNLAQTAASRGTTAPGRRR